MRLRIKQLPIRLSKPLNYRINNQDNLNDTPVWALANGLVHPCYPLTLKEAVADDTGLR